MQGDIIVFNKLSPDAYSIANLSLAAIFQGLSHKVSDPRELWDAIHHDEAFGADVFLTVIEQLYQGRFVKSYDDLYDQVENIKLEAATQIEKVTQISSDEIKELKKLINQKDLQVANLREDYQNSFNNLTQQTREMFETQFKQRLRMNERQFERKIDKMQEKLNRLEDQRKDFTKYMEKQKLRYYFQRLVFVSQNKAKNPRLLDFIDGSLSNKLIEQKQKYKAKILDLRGEQEFLQQEVEVLRLDLIKANQKIAFLADKQQCLAF